MITMTQGEVNVEIMFFLHESADSQRVRSKLLSNLIIEMNMTLFRPQSIGLLFMRTIWKCFNNGSTWIMEGGHRQL